MRYSLILLLALIALTLGIHYYAEPENQISLNPERDLHELTLHDPGLGQALADADNGDIAGLTSWLNRADYPEREHLAKLLNDLLVDPKKNKNEPDAALCWKYRNRFRAFINLSTGSERLDIIIDNMLAYTLVTGPVPPSDADLNLARSLELRLAREAKDGNDAALSLMLEDTVGCIEFAAKNYSAAHEAFALSLGWATQLHDAVPGLDKLEKARSAAALHNAQAVTLLAAHPSDGGGTPADASASTSGPALAPAPGTTPDAATTLVPLPPDDTVSADPPKH